jgi:hypothetical protein
MNAQQEIQRNEQGYIINQLGVTYNQYGKNLLKQLNLNYYKLYGKAINPARKGTQRQSFNGTKANRGI